MIMNDDKMLEIVERLARIEAMLESDIKQLDNRVTKLENANTWLVRTVGASIVLSLLGLLAIK